MAENKLDIAAMNQEDVQKVLDVIKRLLSVGKGLAALTPTKVDDGALEMAEKFIGVVEPIVQEEWFAKVFSLILDLFNRGKNGDEIVAALSSM